jgi:thiol-disulfide isomerase/thioredoxin
MKVLERIIFSPSFIVLTIIMACTRNPQTPLQELTNLGQQMSQHQQVAYTYYMDHYSSFREDTSRREGIIYFEENPADTSIGFNFHQESEDFASFYNGAYLINMVKRDSFAYKKPLCNYKDGHMTVHPHLELSYAAIQNFLSDSLFAASVDSIIKSDTVIDNAHCYSYTFWIDSRLVDTYKLPKHFGRKKIHLVISMKNHLPVLYSQYQPFQNGKFRYQQAKFSKYSFDRRFPKHQFSIENVPSYYSWDKFKALYKTLDLQTYAPDWKLPIVSGNYLSLSESRGKYILLDFWFIGCGACVKSIPILNTLQEKFGESNFEVIGINCYSDNETKIEAYCKEHNMQYRNVWEGESICDDYLIKAAPVFYLIDKDGKVAYSQIGHDEMKLTSNVERALNQGL